MKTLETTPSASTAKRRAVKPVTVTFTGEMAEIIRAKAKAFGRKPSDIAAWFCETGCDRPVNGGKRLFMEIDERLRPSLQRLIDVSSYEHDVNELALDTMVSRSTVVEAAAMTLIHNHDPEDRKRIRMIAQVAMEERIRQSTNPNDEWIAKNTLNEEEIR